MAKKKLNGAPKNGALKIHADKPDSVVQAAMRDYRAGQMTSDVIARKHGVCPATLTVWAKKSKVPLRSRGRRTLAEPTPRHLEILKLAGVCTYTQIGRRLGMHKQQVHRIVKRWRDLPKGKAAPFVPGDIINWKGAKLTVVDAELTEGTLKNVKTGQVFRHFTWAGPQPLVKVGFDNTYAVA